MSNSHQELVKGIVPKSNRKKKRRITAETGDKSKAASYARFSSDMQNESSNDDQHRENLKAAKRNDHKIEAENYYSDKEVSGTKPDREGLNELIRDAKAGKFSTIYFFSLSRLARQSLISMSILKNLVHVHGIRFVSVSEGIDSDQPGWEMAAGIVSMFHERYIQQLAADVLRGQEGCVLEGFSVGDHRFGYRSVEIQGAIPRGRSKKPPKTYEVNQDEAQWVVAIFKWFVLEKRSITQIVKLLNQRKVPKGHRKQRTYWTRSNVISILESPKYVGVWSWGLLKNHRDPETGKVWQEPRDEDDLSGDWVRYRPELQMVDVELFKIAQCRLQTNRELNAQYRDGKGHFNSQRGSRGNPPRYLVSNLLFCAECNHRLYIGGTNGKYLFCPNFQRGTCGCKARAPKDLATNLILQVVTDAVMANEDWLDATFRAVNETWVKNTSSIPGEIRATERAIEVTQQKIETLLDRIEDGNDEVSVKRRLQQRRKELVELNQKLTDLKRCKVEKTDPPTLDWVRAALKDLVNNAEQLDPATIDAIQQLLGRKVVVEQVGSVGSKRRHLRGFIKLSVSDTTNLLLKGRVTNQNLNDSEQEFKFVIDFKKPHPLAGLAEEAKRLYDEGHMNAQIAIIMGRSRSMVTKLLKFWFESRGLEMPDGRSRRSTLERKHMDSPYFQKISNQVQSLLDDGLLLVEVANSIGCDINTVRSASRFWHESRGLEYQDGRSRRKSLTRKSRCQ